MIIEKRLKRELDQKEIIPENQMGFRKGRSVIDNIYILNHVVDQEIAKEGGKVYAFFIDLKAAFDNVIRNKLWKIMEKYKISQHLIERTKEIYAETINTVSTNKQLSEPFWTTKGLRQGCPLSPILFSLYIADIETYFKNGQTGGVLVGKKKIWTLAYADDIVLLAKHPNEMREMMRRLEKYLGQKYMELNTTKSKVMEFRKGGGRTKCLHWTWENKQIEQVKEFKYLGYTFQRNNEETKHIDELAKKALVALGQVWKIGEELFKDNFRRRMNLFDYLVKSIMLYGSEIWGWKEHQKLEKIQEKYIKWILRLERSTPEYIVLEETKRNKLKIESGKRAIKYEEKIRQTDNKLLEECWKEVERSKRISKWKGKRQRYFERNGYSRQEIQNKRERGENVVQMLIQRDIDNQKQQQWNKITESRYHVNYKKIYTIDRPRYLKTTQKNIALMARFRCGNEELANKYWKKEEEKTCRICQEEKETLEHMMICVNCPFRIPEEILEDTGKRKNWLKQILDKRVRK